MESRLLLLTALLLLFTSTWLVTLFTRLENAKSGYSDSQAFEDSCHVSMRYRGIGKMVALALLSVSVVILLVVSGSL